MCGARMNFCGAELAPREQKFFPCAFAARERRRRERQRRGGSRHGVLRARKIVQWTIFTEQRAGRPWKPLHFKSAAATCAVRGEFLRSGACPAEQKFIHCAFAARESRRDERQRRGGSRQGDVSPCRGLCNSPVRFSERKHGQTGGFIDFLAGIWYINHKERKTVEFPSNCVGECPN